MPHEAPHVAYADMLVDLLCLHPRLSEAIRRKDELDDARHYYLDTWFAEVALQEGWTREAIHSVLNTANRRAMREPLKDNYLTVIVHEASLRRQIGHLDGAREALLEDISKNWQIDIVQVIRHGKENSVWSLRLLDGVEVKLGSSEDLLKQSKVRAAIFDVTGRVIPAMTGKKSDQWDMYLERLANVAITVDTPELPRKGYVLGLLHQYLYQQSCVLTRDAGEEEWNAIAMRKEPFVRKGGLHLNAPHFHQFCHLAAPELTRAALLDLLRHIGGIAIKISCGGQDVERTSRAYWRFSPLSTLEEAPGIQDMSMGGMNGTTPAHADNRVESKNPTLDSTHDIESIFNEI